MDEGENEKGEESVDEDEIVCMECGTDENEELLLLCSGCPKGCHTFCNGLGVEVPKEEWFCSNCGLFYFSIHTLYKIVLIFNFLSFI